MGVGTPSLEEDSGEWPGEGRKDVVECGCAPGPGLLLELVLALVLVVVGGAGVLAVIVTVVG